MGDALQPVRPGDPLRIGADTWNAVLAAAADHAHRTGTRPSAGQLPEGPLGPSDCVWVKNATEVDLPEWSILRPNGVQISPAAGAGIALGVSTDPVFTGTAPDTDTGPVFVLLEPVAAGSIGRAVAAGVALCRLYVNDAAHDHAEPVPGNTTRLTSCAHGRAEILWRESAAGEVWALVLLGPWRRPGFHAELTTQFGSGWNFYRLTQSDGLVEHDGAEVTGYAAYPVSTNRTPPRAGARVWMWPGEKIGQFEFLATAERTFLARLTTAGATNGWNFVRLALDVATGTYIDDGAEVTGAVAVPSPIDGGGEFAHPVEGLRVVMWPAITAGHYEFLPVGYAGLGTDPPPGFFPGLVSTTTQFLGGRKGFYDGITVGLYDPDDVPPQIPPGIVVGAGTPLWSFNAGSIGEAVSVEGDIACSGWLSSIGFSDLGGIQRVSLRGAYNLGGDGFVPAIVWQNSSVGQYITDLGNAASISYQEGNLVAAPSLYGGEDSPGDFCIARAGEGYLSAFGVKTGATKQRGRDVTLILKTTTGDDPDGVSLDFLAGLLVDPTGVGSGSGSGSGSPVSPPPPVTSCLCESTLAGGTTASLKVMNGPYAGSHSGAWSVGVVGTTDAHVDFGFSAGGTVGVWMVCKSSGYQLWWWDTGSTVGSEPPDHAAALAGYDCQTAFATFATPTLPFGQTGGAGMYTQVTW